MRWAEPWWLFGALGAGAALIMLWAHHDRRQRMALATFAAAHLHAELTGSVSQARRMVRRCLLLVSVLLLFVALARPQYGFKWQEIKRQGVEIMFAIDTSKSMLTPDVKPDRLTRAKLAVTDFVNRLDGDAVGLVAFAGSAFLQCPATLDYDAFADCLNILDTSIIPRGGTNISAAIREAQAALAAQGSTEKILILLTDGEDLEGDAREAAAEAGKQGLKIYTVGVGTPSGDLIPAEGGGFLKDEAGQWVKSHLDESGLKSLAEITGGLYAPLGTRGEGLELIYQKAVAPLAKRELASRREKIYTERFQWPLACSLFCLLGSLGVGTRRRSVVLRSLTAPGVPQRGAVAACAAGLWLAGSLAGHASVSAAEKAYQAGDYAKAEDTYAREAKAHPDKSALQFNLGTSAYKKGDYETAAQAFQQSVAAEPTGDARRLEEQQNAYYNL